MTASRSRWGGIAAALGLAGMLVALAVWQWPFGGSRVAGAAEVGTALQLPDAVQHSTPGVGTGKEFISILTHLVNTSDHPITIVDVSPLETVDGSPWETKGLDEVFSIVDFYIIPRRISMGDYQTIPLTLWEEGGCEKARVHPPEGYLLREGEDALLGTHFRLLRPGRFRLAGQRVLYSQAGNDYYQDFPAARAGSVADRGRNVTGGKDTFRCARSSSKLPGFPKRVE